MGKEQELILAAKTGNVAQIDKILSQRAKKSGPLLSIRKSVGPNCQDNNGCTPLHQAALNGKRDAVEMLLKYEASTNIPDFAGSYPLHLAAWNGYAEVVELLLNRGPSRANVNETNNNNETALHLACQYGHNKVIVVLLECLANPNLRNSKNESALDLAAQYGRLDAVNYLLTYFPTLAKATISSHSPIHLASRNGHYDIVNTLLNKGMSANLESNDGTPLHVAALFGKSNIVKLLLQNGVDINLRDKKGQTVMDLLSANPSQRSREITAKIYTHIQNEEKSSYYGGKSRTVSDACNLGNQSYDEIPPPRPISEFGNSSPKVHQSTRYDEIPPPLSSGITERLGYTAEEAVTGVYDIVPPAVSSRKNSNDHLSQTTRRQSYDEVPTPRSINASQKPTIKNSVATRKDSSPQNYDIVPPPRQASEPINTNHTVLRGSQSFSVVMSEYNVPFNNSPRQTKAVESSYGMVNRSKSATMPAKIRSAYEMACLSASNVNKNQQVTGIYGLVQAPISDRPMFAVRSSESQNVRSSTQQNDNMEKQNDVVDAGRQLSSKNQRGNFDSSYEFVELPYSNEEPKSNPSSPILIPSQHRSLPRNTSYDTVVLSPPRRVEPIGASESPYGNIDVPRNLEDRKAGDGLVGGRLETRSDPEGAKKRDLSFSPAKRMTDYENIVIPPRKGSINAKTDMIYENVPASPANYEFNIPRSHQNSTAYATPVEREMERSSPSIQDIKYSPTSFLSKSSPSERRTTDYENFELPFRSPTRASPSSKSRNAYEILPPHILHAPVEPGSPKPDAQGRVRPPLPKPYRQKNQTQSEQKNSAEDDYCTLREAFSGVTSPTDEFNSPYPPFSPPSPTTACDVLLHAFEAQAERNTEESDESDRRTSDNVDGSRPRNRSLKYENVMFDHPAASKLDEDSGANTSESRHNENLRLSSVGDGPIDEYEEWKKIENFMNILGEEIGEERKEVEHTTSDVGKWLSGFDLGLYESYLMANGFDDIEFLAGGILEEQDLLQMGVLDPVYRRKILDNVAQLPLPPRVGVNNFKPSTVEEWLNALRLEEYLDLFHQKGYDSIDRIKQMWELELESILAIHTLGHRKRILASLPEVKRRDTLIVSAEDIKDRLAEIDVFGGERRETLDMVNPGIYQWKSSGFHEHSFTTDGRNATEIVQFKEQQSHNDFSQNGKTFRDGERKHGQQQREMPPPKFMHKQQNQQKEHAQLPSQVQAPPQKSQKQEQRPTKVNIQRNGSRSPQWNHPPEALLRGSVNYTTKYLGSHFIKDIIGESSTIEACRKMRMSTQKLQKIPAVILSISVTGVRFIDAKSRIVISSHYIHNISYCTQDLEDRSVLAYIAKDQKANAHYCHVFKVHNSAVSDEIVMTLGQAFELAYEQYTHAQYTSGNK